MLSRFETHDSFSAFVGTKHGIHAPVNTDVFICIYTYKHFEIYTISIGWVCFCFCLDGDTLSPLMYHGKESEIIGVPSFERKGPPSS